MSGEKLEVFSKPVKIGGVLMCIFKNPKEGQRYTPANKYKIDRRVESAKKKVYQYSLNKVFLEEFNSVREASQKTGISRNAIWSSCTGRTKTPIKFFFFFELKEDDKKSKSKDWDYSNKNFKG